MVQLLPEPVLDVHFYASAQGHEPVRVWLKSLPRDMRHDIGAGLKLVQFGWPMGMPLVRKLRPDLWECRVRTSSGDVRIFFTVAGADMVLLHAFVKSSQKTPRAELEPALAKMKEVHRAQGKPRDRQPTR